MGKNRDRDGATVLRGDIEQTRELIDANPYKTKYTSGVLSFEEKNIPEEEKQAIMNSFEESTFAGLDRDQYDITWIEHTDKGRLELNYLIPNQELTSGKRLQPYYHKRDGERMNAWKDSVNAKYNYADPNDPLRKQTLVESKRLPKNISDARTAIDSGIAAGIQSGTINDRDDIVRALENNGFEIARQTKTSISIKNPDGGRNIRLTGAHYEQSFKASPDLRADIEAAATRYRGERSERLQQSERVLKQGIDKKREYNAGRYPRPEPRKQKKDKQKPLDTRADFSLGDNQRIDDYRPELVRKTNRCDSAIRDSEKRLEMGAMQPSIQSKRQHHQMRSGVDNDGIRERISAQLHRFKNGVRETAQRVTERAKKFRDDVREHIERQSKTENRSDEIAKHAREFHKSAKPVVEKKLRENHAKREMQHSQAPQLTRTPKP